MDIDEARSLAEGLMRTHGLTAWTLVFDRARTRAGVCRYDRREIGLSRVLTELHPEQTVRGTILHEIAHALLAPGHGHDAAWRAKALAIGGDGQRCLAPTAPRARAPWVGVCARGHEVYRHRRPTRPSSCDRCGRRFDVAHLLAWRLNGRPVLLTPAQLAELAALPRSGPARAPVAWLSPGTTVVLGGSGRYAGLSGQVITRGRTRYHVRTALGTVTAPFALVRAAARPGEPAPR
ncbi:SprT family zinc-dependent metalloprotease [Pengzhenrongella sicca]|uniref:SprT-like domain-containing protein n=1 Tax=Pengzhenrongella sicca TaxID=2819238 RepID=A0A8A4Z8T8_9MICO|nr:SprT-like domain-containing protein [Pengzhenrongella sicca]QTE27885.1 SprT-like domain-containing protein [Pengzhenrongella sicca]